MLAVIAYPLLSGADRARIQSVREQHDPQFGGLDPHFTLVFPVDAALSDVVAETTVVANSSAAFPFVLNSVRAVKDAFDVGGHVFLIAEQGASQIVAIRDRLYGGSLKAAHRADIPYVPHITLAAYADFSRCQALARELEDGLIAAAGRVDALTVVDVSKGAVRPVASVPLTGTTR